MKNNIETGLSSEDVKKNRIKYGSNKIIKKIKITLFKMIMESFSDPIIKILLIALSIKLVFLFKDSDLYEVIGIFIAVFLATTISSVSEYGSEKAFEKLNEENSNIKVKVKRDGKLSIINIDEIVVGDIVILESGDKVPADGKIIQGDVYIDESILTGESKEQLKSINNPDVYMGSIVTNNKAIMEVSKVGSATFYGKIANDIQEKTIESPLKSRLRILANTISKFGYIAAFLVLFSYMINAIVISNNFNLEQILKFKDFFPHLLYALTLSVTVVVMAVPEGLPMMITLVLSSNMKRLLKKNVLVKKLVGIETAGSLNILFTDKTGTLTQGNIKMEMFCDTSLNQYTSLENINKNIYQIVYQSLVYNNESFYENNIINGGNSTDKAILEFSKTDKKDKYKILNKEYFDSKKKYSSVTTDYNEKTIFIKGAAEEIINKCTKYLKEDGETRVFIDKRNIIEKVSSFMNDGKRVLALAYSSDNNIYILVGIIILKDFIRQEAFQAIKHIKNAYINIVMVTGDSKETSLSVARELQIIKDNNDIILSSEEFNLKTDEEIKKIIPKLKVLYRSLPQDKNRLVRLSQELGLIVGMTGDGINDAPALKRSDVGFSMGSGSEIAKEASDIVILDNNINSISTAILYGRTIFKSIRKFVTFQLTINFCAVLLSIIGPFIGILSPITIIQMLWINMVMDTLAGLAFSYEPALIEYMEEKPKKRDEKIINKYMKNQIIYNGIYSTIICIWFLKSNLIKNIFRQDLNNKYVLTAFFGLFIFLTIFNAFNSRTYRINILSKIFKNKVFLFIITFITLVQILLIYFGGDIFRTTGLTFYELEFTILIAFTIIPFDFIRKIILKKNKSYRGV